MSIAVADSANPSTVGPALWYALGTHARRDILAFTAGVFLVSTSGGFVLTLGPGQGLLQIIARPRPHTRDEVELALGALVLGVAGALWLLRKRVAIRLARQEQRAHHGSALLLGAGIMAAELPTAFPYIAALAAVVAAPYGIGTQLTLVVIYNAVFVAPLLGVLGVVVLAGDRGAQIAATARSKLDRYTPVLTPVVLAVVGLVLIGVGAVGLTRPG